VRHKLRLMIKAFWAVVFSILFVGCSSSEKINTDTAEGAFKLAEKYEKDERYEESIQYFSEVKNKHPYSRLAIDAELKIADIEYIRENYVEAETAYKVFKDLHPDHSKIDYVTYRLAMSFFKQLPDTTDRDLGLATNAILYFDEVISSHPKSEHVKAAIENKDKARKMLADKDAYVARFYYKREAWGSALGRYEDLMKNHVGTGYEKEALVGATLSAYKAKEMDKAKSYFKQLLAQYPNTPELESTRKELADGF
jgi:outer membrane protein assembly factor BamD